MSFPLAHLIGAQLKKKSSPETNEKTKTVVDMLTIISNLRFEMGEASRYSFMYTHRTKYDNHYVITYDRDIGKCVVKGVAPNIIVFDSIVFADYYTADNFIKTHEEDLEVYFKYYEDTHRRLGL